MIITGQSPELDQELPEVAEGGPQPAGDRKKALQLTFSHFNYDITFKLLFLAS